MTTPNPWPREVRENYKWKQRQRLVNYLRSVAIYRRHTLGWHNVEELLTDLSRRKDTTLAKEARNAIDCTSDAQWKRLIRDVNRGMVWRAEQ